MIAWALETIVASSLLMLVVLALRGPVAQHFGPRIAYALWLLPALRMVLPPLPAEVAPAPLAAIPDVMHVEQLLAAATLLTSPTPAVAAVDQAIDWPQWLLAAWVAGALVFFAAHLLRYRLFVRRTFADATQLPRLDRDGIEVCASPHAGGPFAAGIFLKSIVLPMDWRQRYAPDELRLALDHETEHHRRCDMSANLFALGVLAVHWWNPIAHRAHRAFRVDQELACDAIVLAGATPAERQAYGAALLKSACGRLPVAACALGAGEDLKRRLRMMTSYRPQRERARLGVLVASMLVGGGLLLTASGGIAAETTRTVERKVRTALLVPPAPPAPIAPPAAAAPVAPRAPAAPRTAPTPPTPPTPPSEADLPDPQAIHAEVMAETEKAMAEADADIAAATAQLNAIDFKEIEIATREAGKAVERTRIMMRRCGKDKPVVVREMRGDASAMLVTCDGAGQIDRAAMRARIIGALEQARTGIARGLDDAWARTARENALAAIDRKLAELRAQK